jgi:hypothetical protein
MRLEAIVPYAGVYFSHSWIRKNILKQSDEEIEQMDMEIASEEGDPQYEKLSFMTPGGGMVPPPGEEPFPPEGGEGEEGEEGPPQNGPPQNGPPGKGPPQKSGSQKKPPPK